MNILITGGPAYEPLDEVRTLTNCATGKTAVTLAKHFLKKGHKVWIFLGTLSKYSLSSQTNLVVERFGTNEELARLLEAAAKESSVEAVLHTAALCDFRVGRIWNQKGEPVPHRLKLPSQAVYHVELVPLPKVINRLADWFPGAMRVGWKFEVTGDRVSSLQRAVQQVVETRSHFCVLNGRGYGEGYGVVGPEGLRRHARDVQALAEILEDFLIHWGRPEDAIGNQDPERKPSC